MSDDKDAQEPRPEGRIGLGGTPGPADEAEPAPAERPSDGAEPQPAERPAGEAGPAVGVSESPWRSGTAAAVLAITWVSKPGVSRNT